MRIQANRKEGYQLLHEGAIELARIESAGIRVDVEKLGRTKVMLTNSVRDLKQELEEDAIWRVWKKRFGCKSKMSSRNQLAAILYEDMGFEVTKQTEGGKPSADEEALQKIDHPFVTRFLRMVKYDKALGTFLRGIEKEVVNGRLHPVFNLHTVRTYRSSSDSPNFQSFPVRDKGISRIIRSLFIPSSDCVLVENDFKGIEVSVSACYHLDPNFISYINTPGKDMHRDMAAQLYCLKPADVSKDARQGAKSMFVFPQFYGDYYVTCAKSLWEWIEKKKLTGPGGVPLLEHLEKQGIESRGPCDPDLKPRRKTFEHHVKEVENDFWNNRFKVYGQWKKDWFQEYLDKGYFDTHTGFRVHGTFNKNAVTNYPVQGSAFHCLLWSLIQVNRTLRKYKMKSRIVGQIHDSLLGDVREEELRDYLEIVERITTVDLLEHYKWLVVPMRIECEIAPPGASWFDKQEVKFSRGRFTHPTKPNLFTDDPAKLLRVMR